MRGGTRDPVAGMRVTPSHQVCQAKVSMNKVRIPVPDQRMTMLVLREVLLQILLFIIYQ